MSDADNYKCGWVDRGKADYIHYLDTVIWMCYIFSTIFSPDDLRNYIAPSGAPLKMPNQSVQERLIRHLL